MTAYAPTEFVAHTLPSFRTEGTDFSAYVTSGADWTGPSLVNKWSASAVWTEAARESAAVWRSAAAGVIDAAMPAIVGSLRLTPTTFFAELSSVLLSAMRGVVFSSTTTAGKVWWTNEELRSAEETESLEVVEAAEDRRVYALAAVEKLQRLLRLNQDGVASLVGISRPTLWNWQQGRSPQERSLRRLYSVASAVDVLVDACGGDDSFDPLQAQVRLGLESSIVDVLREEGGPRQLLDCLFAALPTPSRPSTLPTAEDFLGEEVVDVELDAAPSENLRRRPVRRRSDGS